MLDKLTVLDRLEIFAGAGETSAPLKLWKGQIAQLEKQGFFVEQIADTDRFGEYYCNVQWSNPTFPKSEATEMLKLSINALNKHVNADDQVPPPYSVRI